MIIKAFENVKALSSGNRKSVPRKIMDQIIAYLPAIGLAYTAFLLSIMSPGPNVLAIMGTAMGVGRMSGLALALGVAGGSFAWAVFAATGLSALLAATATALIVIKVAGGLYLLWLSFKAFRAARSRHDLEVGTVTDQATPPARYFLRGLMVQLTNPKAALAWIAIISLGLEAGAPNWVALIIVAGTTLLSIIIHVTYAVAFSSAPMIRVYGKSRRVIQFTLGGFFAFAGFKLLSSKL
jgi:amino acid exporter